MARPIEFNSDMGSPEAHQELLDSRIAQVQAELDEANSRGNKALAADAAQRLEELNAQREQFELQDQEAA